MNLKIFDYKIIYISLGILIIFFIYCIINFNSHITKLKSQIDELVIQNSELAEQNNNLKEKNIIYKDKLNTFKFSMIDMCNIDSCLFESDTDNSYPNNNIYGFTKITGYYTKSEPIYGYEGFKYDPPEYRDQFVVTDANEVSKNYYQNYNHGENEELKVNINLNKINQNIKYLIYSSSIYNQIELYVLNRPQSGPEHTFNNVPFEIINAQYQ